MSKREVSRSLEFDRILKLPKRDWEKQDLVVFTDQLTNYLKTENGTMRFRHIQSVALSEFYDNDGLFGSIAVGYGKSLITYLAPTVCHAERPLLLIPAKLLKKTLREIEEYGKHFKITFKLKIMSYELLSRDRGQRELLEYAPDLIMADECHKLKNTKTACTKRIHRWFKEHPETKMMAVSGTITRKSIMDYWHILKWCKKEDSPLPSGWREVKDWALCLDEAIPFGWQRLSPGVLLQLCTTQEQELAHLFPKDKFDLARKGYRNRLTSTPGIVATSDSYLGSSIFIDCQLQKTNEDLQEHFQRLRETWQTPNGVDFMDAMVFWRHCRELANGFYYQWTQRPPNDWLEARKQWAGFVRQVLTNNRRGIDTEYQVALAVSRGEYTSPEYHIWKEIRESFKPITEAIWLSDQTLKIAANWLKNNEGICWVEHIAFGEKLSELSGLPFFAQGGMCKEQYIIEDAKGPIIASIGSNSEGRNLQHYSKNLIVSCPPSASTFEQLIGRTHRFGQNADEVTFEILFGCLESWDGFDVCIDQAKYVQSTTGQTQKILYADIQKLDSTQIKKIAINDWAWKRKTK